MHRSHDSPADQTHGQTALEVPGQIPVDFRIAMPDLSAQLGAIFGMTGKAAVCSPDSKVSCQDMNRENPTFAPRI